jgi:hypothetical protein
MMRNKNSKYKSAAKWWSEFNTISFYFNLINVSNVSENIHFISFQ